MPVLGLRVQAVLEQKRAENYYRNEKYWNNNLQVLDKIENRYATKREAGESNPATPGPQRLDHNKPWSRITAAMF